MKKVLGVMAAVLVLASAGGGYAAYRAYSREEAVVTVNGQGIPPALYEEAQTQAAVLQGRNPGYYKQFGNINRLIEQMLVNQEAERRGVACSDQDASAYIATQVAMATQVPDGLEHLLRNADLYGAVQPGYLQTPRGERTPPLVDAVATWQVSPGTVEGYRDICTRGRLYEAVTKPGAGNTERRQAIDRLLAQLRRQANITGTMAVETPTPVAPGSATIVVSGPSGSQPLNTPFVVGDILAAFTPGISVVWAGWDLELSYDPNVLAVDSVVRGSLCSASSWGNNQTSPHVVTGCAFQSSSATGTLEEITFHCIASGTSAITLLARDDPARNASGTALFDGSGVDFTTTVTNGSVTCG